MISVFQELQESRRLEVSKISKLLKIYEILQLSIRYRTLKVPKKKKNSKNLWNKFLKYNSFKILRRVRTLEFSEIFLWILQTLSYTSRIFYNYLNQFNYTLSNIVEHFSNFSQFFAITKRKIKYTRKVFFVINYISRYFVQNVQFSSLFFSKTDHRAIS